MILALVNECVACLREASVEDADLIDAAVIFGTGFAPFRGGPLAYARDVGVATDHRTSNDARTAIWFSFSLPMRAGRCLT